MIKSVGQLKSQSGKKKSILRNKKAAPTKIKIKPAVILPLLLCLIGVCSLSIVLVLFHKSKVCKLAEKGRLGY
jgi:hypothetical protein